MGRVSVSEVWYVAYGSNLLRRRLLAYLQGGKPPGAEIIHPGARDHTPPVDDMPFDLPGTVYFAGRVPAWGGGGVAFYDPEVPGYTAGRAYRMTAEQFADLTDQENATGMRRYERRLDLGVCDDGLPMVTFTARHGIDDVLEIAPAAPYAGVMAAGLVESRGWSEEKAQEYVRERIPEHAATERRPSV